MTDGAARIRLLIKKHQAGSPELSQALMNSGRLLSNQTKLNIRRQRLFNTGNLFNSIRFDVYKEDGKTGLSVGSYGVPYAAVWEYGFNGKVQIRQHSRHLTEKTINIREHPRLGSMVRAHARQRKAGISGVREHMRMVNRAARPFLRPAFDQHCYRVKKMILEALT